VARVGQRRTAVVQHQRDGVAGNLRAIQHPQPAGQRGGELLAIGDVAAIDVVAQTQPVFAIQNGEFNDVYSSHPNVNTADVLGMITWHFQARGGR
jgi:hypothetical protein